ENAVEVRTEVCKDLEFFGLNIDEQKNEDNEEIISTDTSKVKVLRIPTNEELVIAMDTSKIVSESEQ
ncbi:MAG: acetate kinase, partial [Ignavibacteriaceae bacterium]